MTRIGNPPPLRPGHGPTATTPTTPTPAPTGVATPAGGLDTATAHGTVPAGGGVLGGGGAASGISHVAARLYDPARSKDLFRLEPGRYPDAVDINTVLDALASQPGSEVAVREIVAQFEAATGIQVPAALLQAALANPSRLLDIFQVTPAELASGFDTLHATRRPDPNATPKPPLLPQHFDWGKLAELDYVRGEPELKELAPGLLYGGTKSDLPDDQARVRVALAEAFNRLADNSNLPREQRFTVRYQGSEFSRLDTFVQALRDDGHDIEVTFKHRAANFASLMTRAPDGSLLDVPAAIMVRTGFKNADGDEAVLPVPHADLCVHIRKGPDTRGPGIDADLKWYQGVPDTGFFPDGLNRTPSWLGSREVGALHGDQATRAVELAGLLGDLINDGARAHGWGMAGYGIMGVCNDSVGVIQHASGLPVTGYPLFMRDAALMDGLQARLGDRDHRDDPEYRTLKKSIEAVPNDLMPDPSARRRALDSLGWEPGHEALRSTITARTILHD